MTPLGSDRLAAWMRRTYGRAATHMCHICGGDRRWSDPAWHESCDGLVWKADMRMLKQQRDARLRTGSPFPRALPLP